MIFKKATYRIISFAFLVLFLSFIVTPTILVSWIDEDVDISLVFTLVEEETKETNEKKSLNSDEAFERPNSVLTYDLFEIKATEIFYCKILYNPYCPGEVAPPPELS
ncbi:MAG: hypothetical protein WD426_20440 [Anditalea sp.]